jgi:hypothetical protein
MQTIEKTSNEVVVEEPSHVATTNETIHIVVNDQVGASVPIKKPVAISQCFRIFLLMFCLGNLDEAMF